MGTATALASAEDDLLEDGQLPDRSAQGQIDQPTSTYTSHEASSTPASAPTKCARSTAFPASLRAARKLAFAVPIAAIAMSYLLVLDVANRNRTRPPFWGAVELQAQFGPGHRPRPLPAFTSVVTSSTTSGSACPVTPSPFALSQDSFFLPLRILLSIFFPSHALDFSHIFPQMCI